MYFGSDPFGEDPSIPPEHHIQEQQQNDSIANLHQLNIKYTQQKKSLRQKRVQEQAVLLQKKKKAHKLQQQKKIQQLREQKELMIKNQNLRIQQKYILDNAIQLFNQKLAVVHLELQNKYLDQHHQIIDRTNWKCLEQNKQFFQRIQNKQQFQQKYIKFIQNFQQQKIKKNRQICSLSQSCRNSNEKYYQCQNYDSQRVWGCCKCLTCWSWAFLMMVTWGCAGLPYSVFEFIQDLLQCYCLDCVRCCECLFIYFGDHKDDTLNRSQVFCFAPYVFGKFYKVGYQQCSQFSSYFPICCKCCLQNTCLCPIGCCINFYSCTKTYLSDAMICCQNKKCCSICQFCRCFCCCSKNEQVLEILWEIYTKYERLILKGQHQEN